MTKFIFDLDGTLTKEETLPLIAKAFGVEEEIAELTERTVMGQIPFVDSFIHRVSLLGKLPVDKIGDLLAHVELHEGLVDFIQRHREQCCIATGNLSCWAAKLIERIGCTAYCSEGEVVNNQVVGITAILKKEEIVARYQEAGWRVVFIGDGDNDVEAMRLADIAVAAGLTHEPSPGVVSVADEMIMEERALCSRLEHFLQDPGK